MLFEFYNPNPRNIKTSDCVIRCLTCVTGLSWDDVYNELCKIGFELKVLPNDDVAWTQFLINHEFKYNKLGKLKGKSRPTVESFVIKNKTGKYVLRVAHHIVAAVDGKYYDLYNSGYRSLYGFWSKNN